MHSQSNVIPETVRNEEPAWLRAAKPGFYISIVLCAVLATLAYKLRIEGIFACPADGYFSNKYLADCLASGYGDYDHGAFWFGLEPEAQRSAAGAEVLFVGSSRMELAFSGATTAKWFAALAVRYYLLGFSATENTVFAAPLLSRIKPQAKVYVINVDRFFDDRKSPPTEQILSKSDMRKRYEEKQSWQFLHKALCTTLAAICGNRTAIFRSRETGVWERRGTSMFQAAGVADGPASNVDRWEQYAILGERFLAQLPVDRHCVLLTIVPSSETRRAEAIAIAKALGLDLVAPQLDGLRTFDGSHLDPPSAERWAEAFFQAAGPQIRRCLGDARALSQ